MKKVLACTMVAGFVLFSGGESKADQHNYTFDGNVQIWDVSGTYTEGDIDMDYTLSQDAKGKITGFGAAVYREDGVSIDMNFTIKGGVKGKGDTVSVKFVMGFKGTAFVDSYGSVKFSAAIGIDAMIDEIARQMAGNMKITLKAAGMSESETVSFVQDLPVGMDGSVDLDVDLQDAGKGVAGTGTLTLSNGEQFNYLVKGKVSASKGVGKLSLKGDSAAKGSSFKLVTDGQYNLTGGSAKILGQSASF